jgi:hypothetical protein
MRTSDGQRVEARTIPAAVEERELSPQAMCDRKHDRPQCHDHQRREQDGFEASVGGARGADHGHGQRDAD